MKKNFELDKCCRTCEFNFNGICADEGDFGYGGNIDDYKKHRECWSIGLNYYSKLLNKGIIDDQGNVK